ncbi:MAG TPA: RidA family protein [Planctomycetota bacterium]|nr:RidA family protein [Planctomycetota bacterium]
MTKEIVATDKAPQAIGPYSQAVIANGFMFCSGQIGLDPKSGQLVAGGVQVETERALENLKGVLGAKGLGMDHVVKTTVFLATMDDFAKMNEVYAKFFTKGPPARATVAAAGLPKGARVEVECVAALGPL